MRDTDDPKRIEALVGLLAAARHRAGLDLLRTLEDHAGPIESWWHVRRDAIAGARTPPVLLEALAAPDLDGRARDLSAQLRQTGFRAVEVSRASRFACLPDPPVVLFVRGAFDETRPSLAVVGARRASAYGVRAVRRLVDPLARAGVTIVSGLARGIDAAAHQATLDAGGVTIAVLGCGPDQAYPPEHRALQARIGERGAVVTEYLPGTPPLAHHFPRRNRLLVALCDALLVVEARIKSGSLTSVRWAADLGRDVLVVPGPIDSPLSEAPTQLLREGATAVGTPEHVLESLGVTVAARSACPLPDSGIVVTPPEARLLSLLSATAVDLDDLVRMAGEPPSRVLAMALSLESRGLIVREPDGRSLRALDASERVVTAKEIGDEMEKERDRGNRDEVPTEGPDAHADHVTHVAPPGSGGDQFEHEQERDEEGDRGEDPDHDASAFGSAGASGPSRS